MSLAVIFLFFILYLNTLTFKMTYIFKMFLLDFYYTMSKFNVIFKLDLSVNK